MPDDRPNPAPAAGPGPGNDPAQNLLGEDHRRIKDAKLLRRAIREKWPIKDKVREALAAMLSERALKEKEPRAFLNYVRAMLEMDRLNNQLLIAEMDQADDEETKVVQLPDWGPGQITGVTPVSPAEGAADADAGDQG